MGITNKEKFKEVFGLKIDDTSDCGFFDCTDRECKDCPVKDTKDWWNSEYKEPTIKNDLPHCQYSDEEIAKSFIEDVEAVKDQLPTTKNDLVPRNVVRRIIESPRTKEQMLLVLEQLPFVTPQEPSCDNVVSRDVVKKQMIMYGFHAPDMTVTEFVEDLPPVNPKEPTTKNCESCRYYGLHHDICNYCYKCSLWTEQKPTSENDLGVDCISRKAVTLNNPCKDCSEKTWCGGFACKEAREYLDNKNKVNRSEQ